MTKEQIGMSAHNAVTRAIRNGLLVKPERCSQCGKKVLEREIQELRAAIITHRSQKADESLPESVTGKLGGGLNESRTKT